ncbi:MAG: hypothetical protein NZT92_10750 [Abditibacteriales bacterium]|nr:hypothetical protein [Abditibacteriales bacterium]MDW8367053.1 hypothetical protein [Abditibacteriales bacterium]
MNATGKATLLSLVGLAALVVIFFAPVLFTDRVLLPGAFLTGFHPFTSLASSAETPWHILQWDALAQYYPWRLFAHRWLRQGIIPLWNPHAFCGAPFLANGQSAVLYPLNFPFWLMDPARAFGWSAALHFFLAGCFTFLLARRYQLSPLASFLSAVTFAFCGWLVAWTSLPTLMNVATWLPLALLLTERVAAKPCPPRAVALGGVLGVVLLAGHFQVAFYVFLAVALRGTWLFVSRRAFPLADARGSDISAWALVVALAVLLAAAQLLPTAELARFSPRAGSATPEGFRNFAMPPAQLTNLLSPMRYDVLVGERQVYPYAEHCGYAGMIPLMLALVGGIVAWRKATFFTALALFALLYALGIGAYPFYFYVPGVSQMGGFGRVLVLWCFSVALLAGFGCDGLMRWLRPRGSHHLVLAVSVLLIAVTVWDLFNFGRDFNPTSPRALIYPRTELTDFLRNKAQDGRVLCLTPEWTVAPHPAGILPPNAPMVYALYDVQGYDSLQLRHYKEAMDHIAGAPGASSPLLNGNMILLRNAQSPLLDALAVKYVASLQPLLDEQFKLVGMLNDVYVYENRAAQPRSVWQGGTTRPVALTEQSPQRISLHTDAPQRGVLILADTAFPGWRASVNGVPRRITSHRVQRAVAVGRGRSKAEFVYFPTAFRVGLFLSGVAVSAIIVSMTPRRRRVFHR